MYSLEGSAQDEFNGGIRLDQHLLLYACTGVGTSRRKWINNAKCVLHDCYVWPGVVMAMCLGFLITQYVGLY